MKSNMFLKPAMLLTLLTMGVNGSASAGTAALNLNISGIVSAAPTWVVDGTAVATGYLVSYMFNNVGSGSTLTSTAHNLYLENPTTSTNLTLTLPSTCTVGSQSVGINFIENGNTITANGSLSAHIADFTSGTGTSTSMQLTGVNNAIGTVTCTTAGNLTYTY